MSETLQKAVRGGRAAGGISQARQSSTRCDIPLQPIFSKTEPICAAFRGASRPRERGDDDDLYSRG